ncbi:polynucleotide kinase 3-phosphatase [Babesia ovis]|uniref:Polynucleotide kinase 3-phosphatase n=1 Tax=Babesia ovis TaxID=5869 RepID=A0A9W5WWE3_BABOV|nr:polynucleotide kinase 3-phosphatase [Babesia ovis]
MISEFHTVPPQWKQHGTVLYQRYGNPKPSDKLAIFDMDSTLMLTPSTIVGELVKGNRPWVNKPAVPNDFIIYNPNVREILLEEIENGKAIVVCSNQSQLFDKPAVTNLIFARIQLLLEKLDIPLYIILAFKRDLCRKPCRGMLDFYENHLNGAIKVNRKDSFYVGDAAGRRWTKELLDANCERVLALLKAEDFSDRAYMHKDGTKYERSDANAIIANTKASAIRSKFEVDFSDCDHKFALNNGLQYYTPEDYFAKLPRMELTVTFDPKNIGTNPATIDISDGMVILVGPPAGGKTFLCEHYLKSFTRISDDDLKSHDACLKLAYRHLQSKASIVIDNTNTTVKDREELIAISRKFGVKCTILFLDVSMDFALHFHRYRKVRIKCTLKFNSLKIMKIAGKCVVPQDTIHRYFKLLEPPTESEGFDQVITLTDDTFPVKHTDITQLHLP